jgi:hypothetical protein
MAEACCMEEEVVSACYFKSLSMNVPEIKKYKKKDSQFPDLL